MKWKNKGHEFDDYAEKLVKRFKSKGEKIYIFGAGILGQNIVYTFEKYGCFAGYIDNDKEKQAQGLNGRSVISFEQYIGNNCDGLVVIAADRRNIPSISSQLEEQKLCHEKDFWTYKEFIHDVFPVLSVYKYDLMYVDLAQICLTERCTLKCKDCAHGCFAVDLKSSDMDVKTAKESADFFFAKVDIVREFVLIGGEPFLYQSLPEIIEYIGAKYRDKILIFSITTNGTIMPSTYVLDLCRKYNVLIRISNYSGTIERLAPKYEELQNTLKKCSISYILGDKEGEWMDYGFGRIDRGGVHDDLIKVFDNCRTQCREIRGNKYYYCVMARSVSDNLGFGVGETDYFDIAELGEGNKKILMEFECGYSEKGYLDMCNHCNGADAVNHLIPAAQQIIR